MGPVSGGTGPFFKQNNTGKKRKSVETQTPFEGFGPSDPGVVQWRKPAPMPADIVAICQDEHHAVRLSLAFAEQRYGYTKQGVAKLMEVQSSRMSEWGSNVRMPKKHHKWFCHATGCNLLQQHIEDVAARKNASGQMTQRERDAAIVTLMTRGVERESSGSERRFA